MDRAWMLVAFLSAGCGHNPGPVGTDAGSADGPGVADAALTEASTGDLAEGPADGGGPDMTWNPSVPNPPAGSVKCGHATFTVADSNQLCMNAHGLVIDSWGMAHQPFPRACNAVTFGSGDYDVWCTATDAYVFAHFAGLVPTGTLKCKGSTGLALSAIYETGSGGGDTGITLKTGYGGVPYNDFDVTTPIDAYVWITTAVASGTASLWMTPFTALLTGPCGDSNAGYRSLVAGVEATWTH
jgi:hypothetical protein